MFGRDTKPSARIDTLIGKAASVQGDVEFAGGLHLDGRVAGNVRAEGDDAATLSVSEHGSIEGSVEAANVVLNGSVRGDIRASARLVLGATARVYGNVHYGVIEMTLGAEIKGKLVPLPLRSVATIQSAPVASLGKPA
ncbi:MAG: polymer-forming cytoskeletal protein [Gammaproteobacteria bacterium]